MALPISIIVWGRVHKDRPTKHEPESQIQATNKASEPSPDRETLSLSGIAMRILNVASWEAGKSPSFQNTSKIQTCRFQNRAWNPTPDRKTLSLFRSCQALPQELHFVKSLPNRRLGNPKSSPEASKTRFENQVVVKSASQEQSHYQNRLSWEGP